MLKIFNDSTGISNYDNMENDKDYWKNDKKLELFKLEIKPEEYLKYCEKGFKAKENNKNYVYTFKESQISMRRLDKMYNEGILFDIPFIYEKFTEYDDELIGESYTFGQEGRHRAIKAKELGIKTIPVYYIKEVGMRTKIDIGKYISKYIIEDFLIDNNECSLEDINNKLNLNGVESYILENNILSCEGNIFLLLENEKIIFKNKKELIKENLIDNKFDFNKLKDIYSKENDFQSYINKYLFKMNDMLKTKINNIIDIELSEKKYVDNRLGAYQKYSFSNEGVGKIFLNSLLNNNMEEENLDKDIKDFLIVDTLLHEYGHLLYEYMTETRNKDLIDDFYSKNHLAEEFINFIIENYDLDNDELFDIKYDLDLIDSSDLEDMLEPYYEDYFEDYKEELFAENVVDYFRTIENSNDYYFKVNKDKLNEETLCLFEKITTNLNLELNKSSKINLKL